uniref:hypothetical protein n=1 Tax=Marinobacterium profundum TaxID=1714300 RepID=UPI00082EF499|nr:hypothetical protein [Marinobacterium profundum]
MTRANVQNEHIAGQLAKVNLAVNVLVKRGLTVTAISIEGHSPPIEIIQGPACREFRQAVSKWINKNGRRQTERVAIVGECQVRWIERN